MKLRTLVVDDSRTMRRIVARSLREFGITEIDDAEDGEAAMIQFLLNRYDLVVTDWNMPKKDGLELLTDIRDTGSEVPVVMITTEAERRQVLKAIDAGVTEFLVKPFDAKSLDLLQVVIDRAREIETSMSVGAPLYERFVEPLISAVTYVFGNMLECELSQEPVFLQEHHWSNEEVNGVIRFSGRMSGAMVLGMSGSLALSATAKMLGRRATEINADVQDVVSELANIISGNVREQFDEHRLDLSPPEVLRGKGESIDFPYRVQPVVVPFGCRWGPITLSVALSRSSEAASV